MTAIQDASSVSVYEPRNTAERELLKFAIAGRLLDLGVNDPAKDDDWDHDRTVRAEFLAGLLTGDWDPKSRPLRSVKLCHAQITGELDLEARKLLCPLLLRECEFVQPINLDEADALSIRLPRCHVPSLSAEQLRTIGSVELNDGFSTNGEISLFSARIDGNLNLSGATLTGRNGRALNADSLSVGQNFYCKDGFESYGEIRLVGAVVGGEFDLTGASLHNSQGRALYAHRLVVGESVGADHDLDAHGEVNLAGASVGGNLQLIGAKFSKFTKDGIAFKATGITIEKDMHCKNLSAYGGFNLAGASIGGNLLFADTILISSKRAVDCGPPSEDAAIIDKPVPALIAGRLTVEKDMKCNGFAAHGEVSLVGARIFGQLSFTDTTLINSEGTALEGRHLNVGLNLECSNRFSADGKINLRNSNISGLLNLSGATLKAIRGWAIDLEQADIENLRLPDSRPKTANKIKPERVGEKGESARRCFGIDLTNARTRSFSDCEEGWPDGLRIRGFVYDRLDSQGKHKKAVKARLNWLRLHQRFTPEIYDQLADVYRRSGDEGAARKVLIAKQWRRRKPYNPLRWIWWLTVGYGYRTWQALIWVGGLIVIGSWVFRHAYPGHMKPLSARPPTFEPIIYAIDVLLPIGGPGWEPTTLTLLCWYWALTTAGWVLSAAVVAGLAGVLKRD